MEQESRSVLRRQAIQRGEPVPTFGGTMKVKTTLTFKRGPEVAATVIGHTKQMNDIAQEDINRVIELEQLLERLTGLRVHISMEEDTRR